MSITLPAPRIIPADAAPALTWGVIGTGIADDFTHALHAHTRQRVVAVTARDQAKTEAFARRHGIPTVHPSIPELLGQSDIDVVYVATPHPLHREIALAAIAAGKHVLIEKPIAMSAEEATIITDAGRAAGVLVMEAMWTRYLPQSDVIRQVLDDGLLGEVGVVTADFGFRFPFTPAHRLWSAELGGGALLDAGIYPVSFASSVLGPPSSVHAAGRLGPSGVDSTASILLATPSGAQALLTTSIETPMPTVASILGSEARLDVHSPFWGPTGVTLTAEGEGSRTSATWTDDRFTRAREGLGDQATAFAMYAGEGRVESPLHPHAEVVSVMATIDEARRQVRAGVSG